MMGRIPLTLMFLAMMSCLPGMLIAQGEMFRTWYEVSDSTATHNVNIHFVSADEEITLLDYRVEVSLDGQGLEKYSTQGQLLAMQDVPQLIETLELPKSLGDSAMLNLKFYNRALLVYESKKTMQDFSALSQSLKNDSASGEKD